MKKENKLAFGILSWLVIGTILGIALDNLGLWLSLGLAIGVAFEYTKKDEAAKRKRVNNERK